MVTSSKSDGFPHNRAMVFSRQSQILLTYWQSWGLSCWFRSSQDKAIASSIILRVLHPRERGRERRRNIFFSFLLAFWAAFVHLSCLIECWHLNEVKGRIATKFFWETIIGFCNDRGLFCYSCFQQSKFWRLLRVGFLQCKRYISFSFVDENCRTGRHWVKTTFL